MNTSSHRTPLGVALALGLLLAACSDRAGDTAPAAPAPTPSSSAAPAPASPVATPPPIPDQWLGQWHGPEGSFVRITGGQGHYDVTIQNLDGPRTFAGTAVGDRIEFQRDGQTEALRASNGQQTGMKWLAEKKDCLTVKAGEGYCRD